MGSPSGAARLPGGAYARVYGDLVTSGLLAELSGSQIKVLLALAVKAHVLGDARAPDGERHFQRLQASGAVTAADRGRLFCCLGRDALAQDTGLDRGTITRATSALAERHLVEKRLVRSRRGRHDYCVYFVRPSSCLGKFDSRPRSGAYQEANSHPVATVAQKPAPVNATHVQKSSSGRTGSTLPDLAGAVPDGAAEEQNGEDIRAEVEDEPNQQVAGDTPVEPGAAPRPPPVDAAWEAAMAPVYGTIEEAGWPVTAGLRRALRAKAVRVDEAARERGASGPSWVAQAVLVTLGRKSELAESSQEKLLAYADGVLGNWMRDGRSGHTAAKHPHTASRPPPAAGRGIKTGRQGWCHEGSGDCLPHRQPRSEAEMLWEKVSADLQLCMTRAAYSRWLKGSRLVVLQRGEAEALLVVEVDTPLAVDWLENRQKRVVQRTVEGRVGMGAEVRFRVREAAVPE